MPDYIKNNKERILNRMASLTQIFDALKAVYGYDTVNLNENLLLQVVVSYFMDIDRFKEFANTARADRHKQAGFTFKWISKLRPVQTAFKKDQDKKELEFNSYFAINAAINFLENEAIAEISPKFIDHLTYISMYRNISGRHFSTLFYLLEENFALQIALSRPKI